MIRTASLCHGCASRSAGWPLGAFGLPLYVLAGGRLSRAGGYEACVRTLHRWAAEVRPEDPFCRGETLEWLLSEHGRDGWADR